MNQAALFSPQPKPGRYDVISPCGLYRYQLGDELDLFSGKSLLWVMLNPSTATAHQDDPTTRKVTGFTRALGYGRWRIVNLDAYRATDPRDVKKARAAGVDVFGPENRQHIVDSWRWSTDVICAWGMHGVPDSHFVQLLRTMRAADYHTRNVYCFGRAQNGQPRHPLMLAYSTKLDAFQP